MGRLCRNGRITSGGRRARFTGGPRPSCYGWPMVGKTN
jgi:hypothetical protein